MFFSFLHKSHGFSLYFQDELETHSKPDTVSVLVYYGGDRTHDAKAIASHDVVLTTYGVLTSAYKQVRIISCVNFVFQNMFVFCLVELKILRFMTCRIWQTVFSTGLIGIGLFLMKLTRSNHGKLKLLKPHLSYLHIADGV